MITEGANRGHSGNSCAGTQNAFGGAYILNIIQIFLRYECAFC